MNTWVLAGTTFVASSVEFVEAATIVLAVGLTQGWRAALTGTVAAILALAALVGIFGPLLANVNTLRHIEIVVGPFLILYGIAWLRKGVWRYSGRKALRDERANFDREVARLHEDRDRRIGMLTAFQGVFIEGLEVAVIVVTLTALSPGKIAWSIGGAAVALVAVVAVAGLLRAPLSRVPENALKSIVGVMLLSLGTFWAGEGLGIQWWAGDGTLVQLVALYVGLSLALIALQRRTVTR